MIKNKKIIVLMIVMFILSITIFNGCGLPHNNLNTGSVLRLHIRANSNSKIDQEIKLVVRDEVLKFLNKELDGVNDLTQAADIIKNNLTEIENVSKAVLGQNNLNYGVKAEFNNEFFPTRVYGDITLDSGFYDALIIKLGDGAGDNWWCVIYPPLCYFEAQTNGGTVYRSLIYDLIKKFFG